MIKIFKDLFSEDFIKNNIEQDNLFRSQLNEDIQAFFKKDLKREDIDFLYKILLNLISNTQDFLSIEEIDNLKKSLIFFAVEIKNNKKQFTEIQYSNIDLLFNTILRLLNILNMLYELYPSFVKMGNSIAAISNSYEENIENINREYSKYLLDFLSQVPQGDNYSPFKIENKN